MSNLALITKPNIDNDSSGDAPAGEQTNDVSQENGPSMIVPYFDLMHTQLGTITLPCELDAQKLHLPEGTTGYIKIGDGEKVIIVSSLHDTLTVHSLDLEQDAIISPLNPSSLNDVCGAIAKAYPTLSAIILGTTPHADYISLAKNTLMAKSVYPRSGYCDWTEMLVKESKDRVKQSINNRISASKSTDKFFITEEHVQNIEEQHQIYKHLVVSERITIICAHGGVGKTAIANYVASQVSELVDVRYVNIDCSGADVVYYRNYAENHGFKFINFDIAGTTQEEFFNSLEAAPTLVNQMFILDTLKKFVDPLNKSEVRLFMKRLRKLCNKGATFVLLGHANKSNNKDGTPLFEGVGDVRNDVDALVYLIPGKDTDGSDLVTTIPCKFRGDKVPITFKLSPDRSVTLIDFVDIKAQHQKEADTNIIDTIKTFLSNGAANQGNIVEYCQKQGLAIRNIRRVLDVYSTGQFQSWCKSKGENNAWLYALTPDITVKTG
ncbi:P-loop NTPase family protein [Zhongshania marina]|uniref:AAA+ ATPase domain-containing protein n=1 Tax=Zhongshania marina TaxID=2304603 RepID=A0ABX9W1U9_9GAMM|nr:hypothetical protein D0911_10065 [Zhongshania marina]